MRERRVHVKKGLCHCCTYAGSTVGPDDIKGNTSRGESAGTGKEEPHQERLLTRVKGGRAPYLKKEKGRQFPTKGTEIDRKAYITTSRGREKEHPAAKKGENSQCVYCTAWGRIMGGLEWKMYAELRQNLACGQPTLLHKKCRASSARKTCKKKEKGHALDEASKFGEGKGPVHQKLGSRGKRIAGILKNPSSITWRSQNHN